MKPRSKQDSSISALVTTAPIGTPPPRVFESTRKSGTTSKSSNPYIAPRRPRPVWHSSKTSSMSRSRHSSSIRAKYPGGGTITPPADSTGSATTAAGEPTDAWSKRSKPASRQDKSQVSWQWRIGQRYAYGAGSANPPGTVGP